MRLKHRKNIFLTLIALTVGGSLTLYGSLDGGFMQQTLQIVLLQQLIGAALYFACFGSELMQSRFPFE